jgi:hypothetical protein
MCKSYTVAVTVQPPAVLTPPPAILLHMITGYWVSQAIYIAAKLGIADRLTDGPVACENLAAATHTHAPSLYRVLRALASVGIFSETIPGSFALTPLAVLLQTGSANSMRALAILYAGEQYRAWGDILLSVQTGQPAFEQQFGMSYFAYLAHHPEADRVFNEAMTDRAAQISAAVLDVYDFSQFKTIVDVGGGYGANLATILRSYPAALGILFDQPHVAAGAMAHLEAAGVVEHLTIVSGDFFVEVPAGGDAYLLDRILHDWDNEHCVLILRQIRRAMHPNGKLLVTEHVLPPGDEPFFGKWLDLHMLVLFGARERIAAEFSALFHAAGFELVRVVNTTIGVSVLEAIPI